MILGTTYIFVSNLEKSVDFYSKLLEEKPIIANDDRWVQFSNLTKPRLTISIKTQARRKTTLWSLILRWKT